MQVIDDELSPMYAALADPTRRAIIARLAAGEATATELAEPFQLTQQAISKHIGVLERAGLISRRREAQSRPCRLQPNRLRVAGDWLSEQRQTWADRYDRLDQHIANLETDAASEEDAR